MKPPKVAAWTGWARRELQRQSEAFSIVAGGWASGSCVHPHSVTDEVIKEYTRLQNQGEPRDGAESFS